MVLSPSSDCLESLCSYSQVVFLGGMELGTEDEGSVSHFKQFADQGFAFC